MMTTNVALALLFYITMFIKNVNSFVPFISSTDSFLTSTSLAITREPVGLDSIPSSVSYTITSGSPLGIVLSEYKSSTVPEFTPLIVSDVTEMSNGALAGIREGDILLGVNGLSAIAEGIGFSQVMDSIKAGFDDSPSGEITIKFFRGSVSGKKEGFDQFLDVLVNGNEYDANENVEVDAGEYEPPTLSDLGIDMEQKEVGVGELFSALFKESAKAVQKGLESSKKERSEKETKKGGGFFGMFSKETIQLDDNPNKFANPLDDKGRDNN